MPTNVVSRSVIPGKKLLHVVHSIEPLQMALTKTIKVNEVEDGGSSSAAFLHLENGPRCMAGVQKTKDWRSSKLRKLGEHFISVALLLGL
jgi:hypothetical protein